MVTEIESIDIIEYIGNSVIQHGKLNDRVYGMKLDKNKIDETVKFIEELSRKNDYSKIFLKVDNQSVQKLKNLGYVCEAEIPCYFKGESNCVLMGKFLKSERRIISEQDVLDNVLQLAESKTSVGELVKGMDVEIAVLEPEHCVEMAEIYSKVFDSYPFPIFDSAYLEKTMKDNVLYAGVFFNNELVSVASAEMDLKNMNAEMTDFATLPEHRGNGFAVFLLQFLEKEMIRKNFHVLYTIARAISQGMNITFKKCGYSYSGTLINNTNIGGSIESMNIWYKKLLN
jgi:putative beta-lysine N-acetyltransferase